MNTLIQSHDVISQFNLRRVIKFWGYKLKGHVYFMLAPPWLKFNPGQAFSGILNQQLDDANLNEDDPSKALDNETVDSSLRNQQQNEINDRMGPVDNMTEFKIHQMVFKKSSFIKEP